MLSRTVVALSLLAVCASAQNGSVYHVLTNGEDVFYTGVGAGGTQQASDGLGTWVAGEDLRGSRLTPLGDFGFRISGFVESVCVGPPQPGTSYGIKFPALVFAEISGLNANAPAIFLNPACTVPSFPLGSAGLVPYGTGPGSSVSFVTGALPSLVPAGAMLLPNNGFQPASAGGTAQTLLAANASLFLPSASAGVCWIVKFTVFGAPLALHDDVDGLWHWLTNSPDLNQYWGFSDNEQNIWQSQSVASDGGLTSALVFPPNADYELYLLSPDPCTLATLAPRAGTTPYSSWTTNVSNEFGVVGNPNGGFDVGRGSAAISLSGTAGAANPVTGVGNQNPSLAPGTLTTLGFATWQGVDTGSGSVRLTWLSVDLLGLNGGDPSTDPGVVTFGGTVRVPVVSAGLLQPVTSFGFQVFGHVTQPGFVTPFLPGVFGVPPGFGGASWQIPLAPFPAPCLGTAVNITYGTTGREGVLGAPGRVTFDPSVAPPSTSRQLFLFD